MIAWLLELFKSDRKKEIKRLERQILELKGRGDYTFDLEKNTEPQLPKGDHLTWMRRNLGYFDDPVRCIRSFYLVLKLNNGEQYLMPRPEIIERNVDMCGGCIDTVFTGAKALKKCTLENFVVYDGAGNFVGNSANLMVGFPMSLSQGDEINLSYKVRVATP
jgi:hypothetical protein